MFVLPERGVCFSTTVFILFQIKNKPNISLKTFFLISNMNRIKNQKFFKKGEKIISIKYPDTLIRKELFIKQIRLKGNKNSLAIKNNFFFYFEFSNFFLSKYQEEIPKIIIYNRYIKFRINKLEKFSTLEDKNLLNLKYSNKKLLRKYFQKWKENKCPRKIIFLINLIFIKKISEKRFIKVEKIFIYLLKKGKTFIAKFNLVFEYYLSHLKRKKVFRPSQFFFLKPKSILKKNYGFLIKLKKKNYFISEYNEKLTKKEFNLIKSNFIKKKDKLEKNFLKNLLSKNYVTLETIGEKIFKKVNQIKILLRKKIFINFDFNRAFRSKVFSGIQTVFQLIIRNPELVLGLIKKSKIEFIKTLKYTNFFFEKLEEQLWIDSNKVFVEKFGEKKSFLFLLKKKKIFSRIFFPDFLEGFSNCVEIIKKKLTIKNRNEENINPENTDKEHLFVYFSHLNFSEKILYFFSVYFSEFYFLISWQSSNFFILEEFKEYSFTFSTYLSVIFKKFPKKIFKKLKNLTLLILNNETVFSKNFSGKFVKNLRNFNKIENREKMFSSLVEIISNLKLCSFKKKFKWLIKNLLKKINTLENNFFFKINSKNLFYLPFSIGLLSMCLREEMIAILSHIETIRYKKVKKLVSLFVLFCGFSGRNLNKNIISLIFRNFFDFLSLKTQKSKRISKFSEFQKEKNLNCFSWVFNFEKIKENEITFSQTKTKTLTCLFGFYVLLFGNNKNFKLLLEIFNYLDGNECLDLKENIQNIIGLLIFSKPIDLFINFLFELSLNENTGVARNAIFLLGIIGINSKNSRISNFLRFLINFYVKQKNENFNSFIKNSKKMLEDFQKNFKSLVLFSRISQAMNFFENSRTFISPCIFAKTFDFNFLGSMIVPVFLERKFGIEKFAMIFIIFFLSENKGFYGSKWILNKNFRIKATIVGKGSHSFVPNIFRTFL